MSLVTPSSAERIVWNAADYAANSAVQHRWARERIARLNLRGGEHAALMRIPGVLPHWPTPPEMIEFATKTFPPDAFPNLRFRVMDAGKIKLSRPFDVFFSNAALHWMEDHPAVLRGAASVLKPGGRLVVSCGGKGNAHDVFLALRPEMRLKRWRGFFRKMHTPYFFYSPGDYEKWLPRSGFKIQRLELAPQDETYDGAAGFAAWLRTAWIPYVQRVPECAREDFIAAVTGRYLDRHPPDQSGRISVRMVRLEMDAVKV